MDRLSTLPILIVGSNHFRRRALADAAWVYIGEQCGETLVGAALARTRPTWSGWQGVVADIFVTKHQEVSVLEDTNALLVDHNPEAQAGLLFCVENVLTAYAQLVQYMLEVEAKCPTTGLVDAAGQPIISGESVSEKMALAIAAPVVQGFIKSTTDGFYFGGAFMLSPEDSSVIIDPDGTPSGSEEAVEHYIYETIMEGFEVGFVTLDSDIQKAARTLGEAVIVGNGLRRISDGAEQGEEGTEAEEG